METITNAQTQFTTASVEVEVLADTATLNLWSPEEDSTFAVVVAALNLSESEALEVGMLLIKASHTLQDRRIARGEFQRIPTAAEIADAHTIAARYPLEDAD